MVDVVPISPNIAITPVWRLSNIVIEGAAVEINQAMGGWEGTAACEESMESLRQALRGYRHAMP